MLTQKRLREILHYDPASGIFTFVKGRRKGKVAGTVHDARGFLKVSIDNHSHLLHRLAWLWMTGTTPRRNIEHINDDRSDNRWANLCEGERDQKTAHRAPWREPMATPGVWKVGERFEAMVPVQGAMINLGSFERAEAATVAIAGVQDRARSRRAEQRRRAA